MLAQRTAHYVVSRREYSAGMKAGLQRVSQAAEAVSGWRMDEDDHIASDIAQLNARHVRWPPVVSLPALTRSGR